MKIRELLTDESKWIKHCSAKPNKNSIQEVDPESSLAGCWCLAGALDKCYGRFEFGKPSPSQEIYDLLEDRFGDYSENQTTGFMVWNDLPSTTFSDVKRLVEELDI